MTPVQAENETVIVLREQLRSQVAMLKMSQDPMCTIPKGLNDLHKHVLVEECNHRGITIPPKATRPQMIVLIRDDVATRQTLAQEPTPEDPDWEMTSASSTRHRQA